MNYQLVGLVAGGFGIIGYILYIRSILGRSKSFRPSITSWMMWSVSYILICATYYFSGARSTIWVSLVYAIFNLVILFLLIQGKRYAYYPIDKFFVVGTVISVLVWIVFRSPFSALLINVGVDGAAIIPTALKVLKNPESENKYPWVFFILADIINIFAIKVWSLHIALYPIMAAIFCAITFFLMFRVKKN